MIVLNLVCDCSLDTRQERYDLREFPVLVRQNIKRTPIELKVVKWQATKLPSLWIRRIA